MKEIPRLIYGTAWKKEQTSNLVFKAITNGFRGIDTASQPKHYNEKGVGEAIKKAGIPRETLFLQTKFTPISGQDPNRVPYDPKASLSTQVSQSFSSSLKNLETDYVDCLILHSPLPIWSQTMEVWRSMEKINQEGGTKRIGISNCYDLKTLQNLFEQAAIKPSILQNRFYKETDYDTEIRSWCDKNGITYQSFWSLTANPHILQNQKLHSIAQSHHKTESQIFFRFLTQLGIVPLTGTSSELHMKEDLEIFGFDLSKNEMESIQFILKS